LIFTDPLLFKPLDGLCPSFVLGAVGAIKVTMGFAAGINEPVFAGEDGVDHHSDRI
jgi:hypothetical protein